jgi:hypothetical protein
LLKAAHQKKNTTQFVTTTYRLLPISTYVRVGSYCNTLPGYSADNQQMAGAYSVKAPQERFFYKASLKKGTELHLTVLY